MVFLSPPPPTLPTEDENPRPQHHRERRNAMAGNTIAGKLCKEPSTSSIEERPPLVKTETHGSLPHVADYGLPCRGIVFPIDPRNGYLEAQYSELPSGLAGDQLKKLLCFYLSEKKSPESCLLTQMQKQPITGLHPGYNTQPITGLPPGYNTNITNHTANSWL